MVATIIALSTAFQLYRPSCFYFSNVSNKMLYQILYQICFLRHPDSRKSLFKFYINLFNGQPEKPYKQD